MVVTVRIKNEKHFKKVVKRLVRVGFQEYDDGIFLEDNKIKAIDIWGDGKYQTLNFLRHDMIEPKDVMNSEPVKYLMENNHV